MFIDHLFSVRKLIIIDTFDKDKKSKKFEIIIFNLILYNI